MGTAAQPKFTGIHHWRWVPGGARGAAPTMHYRIAGTYNEEGRWRGVGLIYEGASHRLVFVTPRDHGKVIEGELASLQTTDYPQLQGLVVTEVRELDRNF